MSEIIIDMLFFFVGKKKNKASFCHRFVSILGENITLEMAESFSNHAKAKIQHVISESHLEFVSYFHKPHN